MQVMQSPRNNWKIDDRNDLSERGFGRRHLMMLRLVMIDQTEKKLISVDSYSTWKFIFKFWIHFKKFTQKEREKVMAYVFGW